MKRRFSIFLLTGILLVLFSYSQEIQGQIVDEEGVEVSFATISLKGTGIGTVADIYGKFNLSVPNAGIHQLEISSSGSKATTLEVMITKGELLELGKIELESSISQLEEITVLGKSQATVVREQAYAVEVVESKGFENLSINANDILGKISGVNIRQSGGLGSPFSLSLNGLSGSQLRVFLDGVPMDYFGSSLSLNNFSANLINRIEVYKGVVPIHLSSDALGGAINILTDSGDDSYLDVSYSVGSFGTHIISLNAQHRQEKSGFAVRAKSFYNTSQNNYKVPVYLVNWDTGKEDDFETWVERFHDDYNSKMSWIETGYLGTSFADQLLVGIMYSDNYNAIQQAINAIGQAKRPYGQVAKEEEKIITNFSYNKAGLLNDKLNVSSYFVAVFSDEVTVDTSSYYYNWFGEITDTVNVGEIENRKTWFTSDIKNYLGNFNAEYALTPNQNIAINYSLNDYTIQGTDPLQAERATQFRYPNTVKKQVLGGAYTQNFLEGRLKSSVFTKYYRYSLSSIDTDYSGDAEIPFNQSHDNFGFGFTASFFIQKFQIKASYENATRFPESVELFGNGLNVRPSPSLLPESSHNYNLGFIYNSQSGNPLFISVNSFIRDAEDFIIPEIRGVYTYHLNNQKVLSKGIDISSNYSFNNTFLVTLNGTYLDKRDNGRWRNGEVGVENSQYGARTPNEPYLFGNVAFSYRKSGVRSFDDSFSLSLTESYVHSFFYRWENLASQDKGIVPEQWTTNLDVVYSMNEERYNFSFGISNLWDARVYDNFQQIRPGRAFSFKIRYFLL
ncbi:MAG: TonB-dependent receptor plug domain-containing protein [Bacteroidota bacterium]